VVQALGAQLHNGSRGKVLLAKKMEHHDIVTDSGIVRSLYFSFMIKSEEEMNEAQPTYHRDVNKILI
jgi:hypothetical protein